MRTLYRAPAVEEQSRADDPPWHLPPETMPRTIAATRYVTPLKEGGSLPAIVEGEDDGLYVLKFRGAGQGPKALVAEWVAGEIGRALGFRVPEIVFVEVDAALGRSEGDPEIRELLKASVGLNLALDYLPGSITFDPGVAPSPDPTYASELVWFDTMTANIDRTVKNPNLLVWHGNIWPIDHGNALYFHHGARPYATHAATLFPPILRDHVLLPWASELRKVDERLRPILTPELLEGIVSAIPEAWLEDPSIREDYLRWFEARLASPRRFVEEADRARARLV